MLKADLDELIADLPCSIIFNGKSYTGALMERVDEIELTEMGTKYTPTFVFMFRNQDFVDDENYPEVNDELIYPDPADGVTKKLRIKVVDSSVDVVHLVLRCKGLMQ
jgi:hypothetical protein